MVGAGRTSRHRSPGGLSPPRSLNFGVGVILDFLAYRLWWSRTAAAEDSRDTQVGIGPRRNEVQERIWLRNLDFTLGCAVLLTLFSYKNSTPPLVLHKNNRATLSPRVRAYLFGTCQVVSAPSHGVRLECITQPRRWSPFIDSPAGPVGLLEYKHRQTREGSLP